MANKEFCLLDEEWIKVLDDDLRIREVSLCELFANAHKYKCLAGESATQDAAVLRVLLAVVITVFYRMDAEGRTDDVLGYDDPEEEILNRWKTYYDRGKFNEVAFRNYLEQYRERFYLFHPQFPFWQVPDLKYGTDYDLKCLVGNMKESNNSQTKHHFSVTDGEYLANLSYAEASRWLIFYNAYAVNIKVDKNAQGTECPVGTGWLGRIGLIVVNAKNIFELLMFNMCALKDDEAWEMSKPIWEKEIRRNQGIEIAPPDNLPQLYTMQSRRVMINRVNGRIVGFRAMGGDFYDALNDSTEQMTLLNERKSRKKGNKGDVAPQTHSKEKNIWREFPSLFMEGDIKPGLVLWMETLYKNNLISKKELITFRMIGLEYGDGMSYTYGDIVDDSLSMSAAFLTELGGAWIERVKNQVEKCEEVATKQFQLFAKNIVTILYNGDSKKVAAIKKSLATRYYFLINNPFRAWLEGIHPETDMDDKEYEWERQSFLLARQTVGEFINKLDDEKRIAAMKSYHQFETRINRIYKKRKEETV